MNYRLSSSSLNLYINCPRCFWLQLNAGVHRPRSIFPSLPGGMDLVIKDYFDRYRSQGELPPEIDGQVPGRLVPEQELMNRWRNWKTGLSLDLPEVNVTLFGALDDCLVDNGRYLPLDYKTRGSEPKPGNGMEPYYRNQLDCYALLLDGNGFSAGERGYLVYYYPREVFGGGTVKFGVKTVELKVNLSRARRTLKQAGECLNGPEPEAHTRCEYCSWQDRLAAEFD
ncbi:MAG: PD-(D/E)XK nuclease family protein [bacterium]